MFQDQEENDQEHAVEAPQESTEPKIKAEYGYLDQSELETLTNWNSRQYNPDTVGCVVRDITYYRLQFEAADTSKDGTISYEELKEYLNHCQLTIWEGDVEEAPRYKITLVYRKLRLSENPKPCFL